MDIKTCSSTLPLYERISRKNVVKNFFEIIIFFLLLPLPVYRIIFLRDHTVDSSYWLLAFLCELWFTFYWVILISTKWNPVEYKTHPDRLLQWVDELPSVDMFVTTADPELEPPIITINTVLSLLAVDYPASKLACYVSDDGCSPIILYSLMEASNFAKLWVPFCKKHNVKLRAPFRYFSSESLPLGHEYSREFQREWKAMKVIWENKRGIADEMPHLVYISREKRPTHPHHYKAGAMNVLARVSGLMTNAPFMLNVDCDMFVNNPKTVLHAMCLLLGPKNEKEVAFCQCPQVFYDGLKDDPFGNQLVVLFEYLAKGVAGIQGPFYSGTGCFHRRKVIYGLSPDDIENNTNGKLAKDHKLLQISFGSSKDFVTAVADAFKGEKTEFAKSLENSLEAANQVAACGYESGTDWGKKVGWIYGSTTEDINTSLIIHRKGWRTVLSWPDPPAFLGCAPTSGPTAMTQQKRWATGLLEILVSKNCPIFFTLFGKLQLRQGLAYLWILCWGLRSIPELCYAALLAYSIITNSPFLPFLPKSQEPAFYIPIALFVIYNLYTLSEYFATGQSIRAWWNNQKMRIVTSMSAWVLGVVSVALKILGISETVFEVTKKDQSTSSSSSNDTDGDAGRFTFDESPIFVPVTTLLLVQLMALAMVVFGMQPRARGGHGSGILDVLCSAWLVLCLWPVLKGLFGKGKYGIPLSTLCKSTALALLFVVWCRRTTMS
ncbi:cellulose synthase-like protein H1 isoform X2 [Morus notabilis]|uniref:cellulose synthase-like protein H1 isoform X2 n=1 Tax=Morus notabilis TaxID=981085 RepID=UPI000CED0D1A|nr:cellulose synthase-like protein H1 isoform X2 [Morus notabilis]